MVDLQSRITFSNRFICDTCHSTYFKNEIDKHNVRHRMCPQCIEKQRLIKGNFFNMIKIPCFHCFNFIPEYYISHELCAKCNGKACRHVEEDMKRCLFNHTSPYRFVCNMKRNGTYFQRPVFYVSDGNDNSYVGYLDLIEYHRNGFTCPGFKPSAEYLEYISKYNFTTEIKVRDFSLRL